MYQDRPFPWNVTVPLSVVILIASCILSCSLLLGHFLKDPQPEQPTWIATYENTGMPDWCARGTIGSDRIDIVEAPYKSGHLYQIWYDNTVFWHYESDYTLPDFTLFTNGDWTVAVDVEDFKGGNR